MVNSSSKVYGNDKRNRMVNNFSTLPTGQKIFSAPLNNTEFLYNKPIVALEWGILKLLGQRF